MVYLARQGRLTAPAPATRTVAVGRVQSCLPKPKCRFRRWGHEPGVVNSTVYAGGRKVAEVAIEKAGEWSKRAGHVVWIGLVEPNDDLLQRVGGLIGEPRHLSVTLSLHVTLCHVTPSL